MALDATVNKGVGLATITSAEENAFVVALMKKHLSIPVTLSEFTASIGCTDDPTQGSEEGAWVWGGEGNRPLMYTNWAPGEPNQSGNREENARHDSAEDFSRLDALLFTAMDRIFIPVYCCAN